MLFENNELFLIGKNEKIILIKENKKIKANEALLNRFNAILGNLESLASIESGDPTSSEFQWKIDKDSKENINGYSVICTLSDTDVDFEKVNEAIKTICDYLEGLDYKSDEFNSTELQEGYISDSYIMTIFSGNENYDIKINFGELK